MLLISSEFFVEFTSRDGFSVVKRAHFARDYCHCHWEVYTKENVYDARRVIVPECSGNLTSRTKTGGVS